MLLIEQQGDDAAEVRSRLTTLIQRISANRRRPPLHHASRPTTANAISIGVYADESFLGSIGSKARIVRCRSSTILPFRRIESAISSSRPKTSLKLAGYGHRFRACGSRTNPYPTVLDLADPSDMTKMEHWPKDFYEKVLEYQGTISGEHALGLSRTWYAPSAIGEPLSDYASNQRVVRSAERFESG